jgi:hypothetical protein
VAVPQAEYNKKYMFASDTPVAFPQAEYDTNYVRVGGYLE